MPFDLKGVIETSDDGTQRRLAVWFWAGGASVIYNGFALDSSSLQDGWDLVYRSNWVDSEDLLSSIKMWLYTETAMRQESADGVYTPYFEGLWEVFGDNDQRDLGQMDVLTDGTNYVEQFIPLGEVLVSRGKVVVKQFFHGVLVYHDTAFIWSQDGGGGGGGGGGETTGTGCYAINSSNKLINQYFIRGGVVETTNFTGSISGYKGLILALKIAATPGGSVSLASYASVSALATASQDPDYIVTPLYWLNSDGSVKVDFRNAPRTQTVEVL